MTDSLNNREQAFENKFKHDEELRFKVQAKAAKLFGLWVAGQLGMSGKEADAYAESIVEFDMNEAGSADIERKAKEDLKKKGIDATDRHLQNQFQTYLQEAKKAFFS